MAHTMLKKFSVSFREPSDLSNPFPPINPDCWANTVTRYGELFAEPFYDSSGSYS